MNKVNLFPQPSINKIFKVDSLKQWLPITLILCLAATLYFYQLGTESLWYDELLSIKKTQTQSGLPPNNLTRPFYFMLLYVWMQFGDSIIWLRGLSVIFGLGSIVIIYQLGRRVAGEKEGLIAAFLLTLSPLFINHAQEVRMYTLIAFVSLSGTLALTNALERPTFVSMTSWVVLRFLALLTSPATLTLLLPDIVLIVWQFHNRRRQLFAFGIHLLFIGSSWLPFVAKASQASTQFLKGWVEQYPKPNLILIAAELTHLTVYWPLRHLLGSGISANKLMEQINQESMLDWLTKHLLTSNLLSLSYYMVCTIMLSILLCVSLLGKHQSAKLLWVKVWALLPLASILLISYASSSIWRARYLIFVSPYLLILLAAGFMQVWRWRHRVAILVALTYAIAVSNGLVHYYTTLYRIAGVHLLKCVLFN